VAAGDPDRVVIERVLARPVRVAGALSYPENCRGNLREAYRLRRDPEGDAGRHHPPGCAMPL